MASLKALHFANSTTPAAPGASGVKVWSQNDNLVSRNKNNSYKTIAPEMPETAYGTLVYEKVVEVSSGSNSTTADLTLTSLLGVNTQTNHAGFWIEAIWINTDTGNVAYHFTIRKETRAYWNSTATTLSVNGGATQVLVGGDGGCTIAFSVSSGDVRATLTTSGSTIKGRLFWRVYYSEAN